MSDTFEDLPPLVTNEEAEAVRPELQAECNELAAKLSEICNNYSPTAVMFVIEAILTQEITNASPTLGRLFEDMLHAYKAKASMLLQLTDSLLGKRGDQ